MNRAPNMFSRTTVLPQDISRISTQKVVSIPTVQKAFGF